DGGVRGAGAQDRPSAWRAAKRVAGPVVHFDYRRTTVDVTHSSVSCIDREWGPGFLKVCGYAPYAMKRGLNGHGGAKRQLTKRGIAFAALDNGFFACDDPAALQAVCATLGAADVEACVARWLGRVPLPLAAADLAAGFGAPLGAR